MFLFSFIILPLLWAPQITENQNDFKYFSELKLERYSSQNSNEKIFYNKIPTPSAKIDKISNYY